MQWIDDLNHSLTGHYGCAGFHSSAYHQPGVRCDKAQVGALLNQRRSFSAQTSPIHCSRITVGLRSRKSCLRRGQFLTALINHRIGDPATPFQLFRPCGHGSGENDPGVRIRNLSYGGLFQRG